MKAAIFDLDGTVLDTQADIGASCNAVLARLGYPQHPIAAYRQMVGNGFDVLVSRALPQDSLPDACAIKEIARQAREYYALHLMEMTKPYPGIMEALGHLAAAGVKLAVLSNKPDEMTKALISHYFDSIPFVITQGALPDAPLKPDPSTLLAILAQMGFVQPADLQKACYVGDSNVDAQTAHNAGIMCIGAAWGFRGAAELEAAGADLIFHEPWELKAIASLDRKCGAAKS